MGNIWFRGFHLLYPNPLFIRTWYMRRRVYIRQFLSVVQKEPWPVSMLASSYLQQARKFQFLQINGITYHLLLLIKKYNESKNGPWHKGDWQIEDMGQIMFLRDTTTWMYMIYSHCDQLCAQDQCTQTTPVMTTTEENLWLHRLFRSTLPMRVNKEYSGTTLWRPVSSFHYCKPN